MKRRGSSFLTSSIDSSLAPSSSKLAKVEHQKSPQSENSTIRMNQFVKWYDLLCVEEGGKSGLEEDGGSLPVSQTEDCLLYLRTLFPVGAFDVTPHHRLPPIILKHQLYALIPDRTLVDRQLVWPW